MLLVTLSLVALMILANALYVAAEFATVGSRRTRVQEMAEGGNSAAAALLPYLQDTGKLDRYVAACQIGITLSSLLVGAYGQAQLTPLLTPYLGEGAGAATAATIIVLLLLTATQVILGELLPKTVALRYPEKLALGTISPMKVSLWLFRPLIALFNGSALLIMRAVGITPQGHTHVHSPEELESIMTDSARGGLIDASEREMLYGVLNLEERVVREIMTPRTRMAAIQGDTPAAVALSRLAKTPHTRFPVYGSTTDDLLGFVNLRELWRFAGAQPQAPVRAAVREPLVVSDAMSVPELWRMFTAQRRHFAVVVDEYGGVAGLVTLEDTLEEVFGELQDEFDREEEPIRQLGNRVSVRGDVLIETLSDRFDLHLPLEEADTVSGLLWVELGREPLAGDSVQVGDITLKVESMDKRAVRRASFVLPGLEPLPAQAQGQPEQGPAAQPPAAQPPESEQRRGGVSDIRRAYSGDCRAGAAKRRVCGG